MQKVIAFMCINEYQHQVLAALASVLTLEFAHSPMADVINTFIISVLMINLQSYLQH